MTASIARFALSRQRRCRAALAALAALASLAALTAAQSAQAQALAPPAAAAAAAAAAAQQGMPPERRQAMDDALLEPRRIAAAVVAGDMPAPRLIVQVGAFQGEFLEVFLDHFATSRGQWTEAITSEHNLPETKARFARFGSRIDFKWGCARRDLGPGCTLPKETDVILIEWLSIQQDLDSMYRIYRAGAAQLPPGGWIVNVDHVTFGNSLWDPLLKSAVQGFRRPEIEGPPVHYPQFRVPTVDEQLAAMRAAGFDAEVVWRSFTTVLFMGRKK